MRQFFEPFDAPFWLKRFSASVRDALSDVWNTAIRLKDYATADLPPAADWKQGLVYDSTVSAPLFSNGTNWVRLGEINVKWFGAVGDGVADDTAAIQTALNFINTAGGGTLYFPEGTYKVTAYLTIYPYTVVRGAGNKASKITTAMAGGGGANAHENLRNGCIFHSVQAINSSTRVNIYVEDIWLHCSNAANVGAGHYDRGGTFIGWNRVRIDGFAYSAVLDQSELADFDECDFENPTTGCVWLVNGADLTAGALTDFTNRISINKGQFNAAATAYGIIDDGGNTHAFSDNNFNGCLNHIRAAGVAGLKISGGEYESAAAAPIQFETTRLAGTGVGQCTAVYIGDGAELIPVAGQSCITAVSLGSIVLDSVYFGNTAAVKFNGTVNTSAIFAFGCVNAGGGATFDGRATNHFEVGNDGTNFRTRTNLPIEMGGTVALDASRNATLNTIELGHANDTTLTRSGAGDIAVEGNAIYRAGGTDVPLADGGTGASDASGARTNLGLGTAAVKNTGTSGNVVPLLDGANTWSAAQTINAAVNQASGAVSFDLTGAFSFRAGGGSEGWVYVSQGSGYPDLHIRPNSGKTGILSFTEDAVADRWSIGIKTADASLYFSNDRTLASAKLTLTSSALNMASGVVLQSNGTQVVTARKTGWATATGTATRTTFDTATVTTAQLAERVKALIDDLHGTAGHGLIGT